MKLLGGIVWLCLCAAPLAAAEPWQAELTAQVTPEHLWVGIGEREPLDAIEVDNITAKNKSDTFYYYRKAYKYTALAAGGKQLKLTAVKDFGGANYPQFLMGIALGEMAKNGTPSEAIKAQMVAANDFLAEQRANLPQTLASGIVLVKPDGAEDPDILDSFGQAFIDPAVLSKDLLVTPNHPDRPGFSVATSRAILNQQLLDVLQAAASAVIGQGLKIGAIFPTTYFFNSTHYETGGPNFSYRGFTRSREESESPQVYNANIRMGVSPDGAAGEGGHGRGMSQEGAKLFGNPTGQFKYSALQILQHYYGPTAPILRSAELWQRDVLKYRTAWRDLPSARGSSDDVLGNFRQQVITANQPLNLTDPIQMKLRFTEDMDNGFLGIGQALGITVSSHNKVTECLEGSTYASCSAERFELTVTPQKLFEWLDGETGTARAGTVTVRVTARHQDVDSFLLDSDPRTLAVKDLNLTPTRGNT